MFFIVLQLLNQEAAHKYVLNKGNAKVQISKFKSMLNAQTSKNIRYFHFQI
jgi:hypothetical protein